MRLELGSRVDCTDATFGKLVDVVIDPISKRVAHLVVERDGSPGLARLVPIELAEHDARAADAVSLRATVEDVGDLPPVRDVAYLRLDGFPVDDPDWDIGIEEVLALPYYSSYDLEPAPVDYAARYDRVPKGEVEIRRASAVESADGHHLGNVDGFLVDDDGLITAVVLEQGHAWERREVVIPIGAVARVKTDEVMLSLTKDEVGALPPAAIRRWPRPLELEARGASTSRRMTQAGQDVPARDREDPRFMSPERRAPPQGRRSSPRPAAASLLEPSMDHLHARDRVRLREDYLDLPCGAVGVVVGFYRNEEAAVVVAFERGARKVPFDRLEPLGDDD